MFNAARNSLFGETSSGRFLVPLFHVRTSKIVARAQRQFRATKAGHLMPVCQVSTSCKYRFERQRLDRPPRHFPYRSRVQLIVTHVPHASVKYERRMNCWSKVINQSRISILLGLTGCLLDG